MTKAVWKYTIDCPHIDAPIGAKWLCAHEQGNDVCVWAEVDQENFSLVTHTLEVYGTGHTIKTPSLHRKYLGTCFLENGSLVLHVFVNLVK